MSRPLIWEGSVGGVLLPPGGGLMNAMISSAGTACAMRTLVFCGSPDLCTKKFDAKNFCAFHTVLGHCVSGVPRWMVFMRVYSFGMSSEPG